MKSTSIRSSGIAYRHEETSPSRLVHALCCHIDISIINIYFEFNGKDCPNIKKKKKQSECFFKQKKDSCEELIALH